MLRLGHSTSSRTFWAKLFLTDGAVSTEAFTTHCRLFLHIFFFGTDLSDGMVHRVARPFFLSKDRLNKGGV